MNTVAKKLMMIFMVLSTIQVQAQKKKLLDFVQLPKNAQEFVKSFYDETKVSYILVEEEFLSAKEFVVDLVDGTKIEFDARGRWKEVDAKLRAVPAQLVPGSVMSYVSKRFPDNDIVQIARKSGRYEVELTNGLDLEFDDKGRFLRIDD